MDFAALESSGFQIVTDTIIEGEVVEQLPGVLDVEAVDVVLGSNLAGTRPEGEGDRCRVGRIDPVLAKVELREQ